MDDAYFVLGATAFFLLLNLFSGYRRHTAARIERRLKKKALKSQIQRSAKQQGLASRKTKGGMFLDE